MEKKKKKRQTPQNRKIKCRPGITKHDKRRKNKENMGEGSEGNKGGKKRGPKGRPGSGDPSGRKRGQSSQTAALRDQKGQIEKEKAVNPGGGVGPWKRRKTGPKTTGTKKEVLAPKKTKKVKKKTRKKKHRKGKAPNETVEKSVVTE